MKLLQVYNRPRGEGGEYVVVQQIDRLLSESKNSRTCYFDTSAWTGPNAPAKWKQALWTIYNPSSARELRKHQEEVHAQAWLFHNVFPVGSASLYREGLRQKIPIIQFIHNFRPFSVSSYIRADCERPFEQILRHRFWHEIKAGAWQESRIKTAVLATGLLALRRLKWLRAVKAWVATTNFMRDKFVEAGVPASDIFVL
ncbi:MAG: hypothetical protein ACXWIU_03720, partial [Limisphaerales bacterium]